MNQLIEFANHNMMLVSGTLIMFFAVIFYELRQKQRSLSAVTTAQAVALINQGATVVDIREQSKFDAGHIIDSINVPAPDLEADATVRVKKNRPVLVVCDSGSLSTRCAATLRQAGYETVYSLQGGLGAWQQENLPVVGKDT